MLIINNYAICYGKKYVNELAIHILYKDYLPLTKLITFKFCEIPASFPF